MKLCLAVAVLVSACDAQSQTQQAPWPTNGWATSSPEAQGLDASPLTALHREIQSGTYGYVDRMVVVRNGYVVVNERYENDYAEISRGRTGALGCGIDACTDPTASHEYNYYHPTTHPYYQGRDLHTLQSVTKSITSAVIGIAIENGAIRGTGTNLLSFFDDYNLDGVDVRLREATLDHLLTMRSGIEWHETDRPIDETNTTLQLERSHDWIQFTLDQPSDALPGQKWAYNSGGSHLMSGIIRKATGRFVDDYANEFLFRPLGINDFHWKKTPTGYPDTEGGLFLEAEQLAKIGYLYLNDGVWDGRRILPEGWAAASVARRVERVNAAGWGYGYQWWRIGTDGTDVWAGLGFGGQFLLVLPQHNVIGVINSWNVFNDSSQNILGAFRHALISAAGQP